MTSQQNKLPSAGVASVPFVDEYFGAWAMYEPKFNALAEYAQTINVQLHLEQHGTPEAREELSVAARHDVAYEVTRGGLAIIELRGTMLKHVSSFSGGTSTVMARREPRAAAADDQVAGIMLLIDSPGGTVAGIHDLARDIAAAGKRKPLHAFAEDLCCSAAYWAGCQAARFTANDGAIVGSIGVFNVLHDLSKKADKEGVEVHVVRFGAHKGAAVPGAKITEEVLAEYQMLVDAYGEDFVSVVAAGRHVPTARARELADGRVYKGQAAGEQGLVDAIESFDDAMRHLAAATNKSRTPAKGKAVTSEEYKAALAQHRAAIVAACPKADEDFVAKQIAAGVSAEEAGQAWMAALQERAAGAETARLAAEEKAAEAEKARLAAEEKAKTPAPQRGNAPVKQLAADGEEGAAAGDAVEEWSATVASYMSGEATGVKLPRQKAVLAAARKHPQLRAAAVAAANV